VAIVDSLCTDRFILHLHAIQALRHARTKAASASPSALAAKRQASQCTAAVSVPIFLGAGTHSGIRTSASPDRLRSAAADRS
jgi:hypothetical protein